jgi:hypothetical protein
MLTTITMVMEPTVTTTITTITIMTTPTTIRMNPMIESFVLQLVPPLTAGPQECLLPGVNHTRVTTNDEDEDSVTLKQRRMTAPPQCPNHSFHEITILMMTLMTMTMMETIRKTGVLENDKEEAEAEMQKKYCIRKHSKPLRLSRYDAFDTTMAQFDQPMGMLFITEQMWLKRGLKVFGKAAGVDKKVVEELKQIEIRKKRRPATSLMPRRERIARVPHVDYLKQKRCGRIKARGCTYGRKQQLYKTKQETSSPTVTAEALFITSTIDAEERLRQWIGLSLEPSCIPTWTN